MGTIVTSVGSAFMIKGVYEEFRQECEEKYPTSVGIALAKKVSQDLASFAQHTARSGARRRILADIFSHCSQKPIGSAVRDLIATEGDHAFFAAFCHGEADNDEADAPLSVVGAEQAEELAAFCVGSIGNVASTLFVVTSPFIRCFDTAMALVR